MLRIESWPPEPEDMFFTEHILDEVKERASRGDGSGVQAFGHAVASFVCENMPNPTAERAYAAFRNITSEVEPVNGAGIDLTAGFGAGFHRITYGGESE